MKKFLQSLVLLLFVGTVTLTLQGCFGLFSDSEKGNGDSSSNKNNAEPSITFSDCSIELNAKDDNGNERMVYHFTAEASGMGEHGLQMILSVESPKGIPHTYVDNEGDEIEVVAKKDFKNKNKTDSFSLKNKIVGIQNSKLHLKKGEHTYYVRLTAYDENTRAEIGSSPYMAVTMTGNGSSNSSSNKGNSKSNSNSSSNKQNSGEPKATFSNCNLEHNVMYNDKKMLKFSCDYNIQEAQGHEVQLVMSVECPKGTTHLKTDGKPLENKRDPFIVNTDNYIRKDFWFGLYNSTLNPKPGKNTYYVCVRVHDLTTGKILGKSDYFSYTQTGSTSSNNKSSSNKGNSNSNSNSNSSSNKGNSNSNNNSSNKQNSNKNSSKGPKASLSNCWIEPNVIEDGDRMLKCHYTLNTIGVKGHKLKVVLSIESPKGCLLKEGWAVLNSRYDSSTWDDKWIGVFNRAFVQPEETTYYVRLMLYDEDLGTTLAASPYMTFTMTGGYG